MDKVLPQSRPGAARTPAEDGPQQDWDDFFLSVPAVSLPKGGGAIRGIDETFSVNPSRGTATLELPLPFSEARGGVRPAVRAVYDSGAGNGLLGVGWALEAPSIRRRTDRSLPRYRGEDVFLLSGSEELVPALRQAGGDWEPDERQDGSYTIVRYRPRIERDFSRIERIRHPDRGEWWKITSADNTTTFYGANEANRIADPQAAQRVFEWLPTISLDDKGNCVVYAYKAEDLEGVPETLGERHRRRGLASISNRHLKWVRYGNREPVFLPEEQPYEPPVPSGAFLFEAVFDYGEHDETVPTPDEAPGRQWLARPDPFSSYRSGFEIRTYRLLRRVLMFHQFDELNGGEPCLCRALELSYVSSSGGSPHDAELSYLESATQSGYTLRSDGQYSKRSLPPVEFEYQRLAWSSDIRTVDRDSLANLPAGVSGGYRWLDLFGEGIAGVFTEQAEAWFFKANLGDVQETGSVRFDAQREVAPKPSFTGVGASVQLRRLEGDGRMQAVVQSPETAGYFEQDDDGGWRPFQNFRHSLRLNLSDRNLRRLDLTGDGQADLVLCEETAFLWYRSDGRRGYLPAERTPKPHDESLGPALVFSDLEQKIFLADMSGDGLTDIVRIRRGDVCYWPNLGYGRFGAKISMGNCPQLDRPADYNPEYLHLADVTGDGTADLLYLGRGVWRAYLNLSGNAWSDQCELPVFPAAVRPNEISVTDLLGRGSACIVWSSGLPAEADRPMRYVDLMAGVKPHLLRKVVNNLGKEIEIEYKSSTWFYLKDKLEGRPWITKLPFPVHCLRRVEIRDRIAASRRVSEYRYHHGSYDATEREFRGFGMVEVTDSERFEDWAADASANLVERPLHQVPRLTKTWYHTGAFLDRRRILTQFRDEYWDPEMSRAGFPVVADEDSLPDARLMAAPGVDSFEIDSASPELLRQAHRSCKGMALRTEVFALDSPDEGATPEQAQRELTPYWVSTHNCVIELLQPLQDDDRPAVFTVKESEAVIWSYERAVEDPRIEHRLNVRVDELGNVLESAIVLYGRRTTDATLSPAAQTQQSQMLVTYQHSEFTDDVVTPAQHRLRRLSRRQSFEIRGLGGAGGLLGLSDFDRPGFHVLEDSIAAGSEEVDRRPPPGQVLRRLIGEQRSLFYDDALLAPLALGQLSARALPYENYELAYTPAMVNDIFEGRAGDAQLLEGGFVQLDDGGWWVRSGRTEYLAAGETADDARLRFFTPVAQVDAGGARTQLRYFQGYFLLLEETEDAATNRVRATAFDLQRLSPRGLRDANDNLSEVLLDELGWVKAAALLGKGAEGDTLAGLESWATPADAADSAAFFAAEDSVALEVVGKNLLRQATVRYVHDFDRYRTSGGALPPVLATIHRERHAAQTADSPIQIRFEYSNGMGQVAMTKVQAEPGLAKRTTLQPDGSIVTQEVDTAGLEPPRLRWLGTGRKVVNNKGNVVKEYEPYFSVTHEFEDRRELVEAGVTKRYHYDPLDRLVRTDFPDGSLSRTDYASWRVVERDRNDTLLESEWRRLRADRLIDAELLALGKDPQREAEAAAQTEEHADTPFTRHLGPLGEAIEAVEHNGTGPTGDIIFRTQFRHDVAGQMLDVTDARGNIAVAYKYDLRGAHVFQNSMDGGRRRLLNNALGEPFRIWDDRGHEFQFSYDDPLHRLTARRVIGGDGGQLLDHVFERRIYGETVTNAAAANLRTRVAVVYDTAGKTENVSFDFRGNLVESRRRFAARYKETPDWSGAGPDDLLEAEEFVSSAVYDALDRLTEQTAADGSVYRPAYNAANLLERVEVTRGGSTGVHVRNIDYNERGQRRRIVYGNDVETTYDYDPETFRLLRLLSRKGDGETLRDCRYTYDPTGNLTHLDDQSVPVVWFDNQRTSGLATYRYDPLYRLTRATGREHAGQLQAPAPGDIWNDSPFRRQLAAGDPFAWRNYTQLYSYDAVGNLSQVGHQANGGSWTRDYTYAADNNRLVATQIGATSYAYQHHPAHGFLTGMPHLTVMRSNFRDELQAVSTQAVNSGVPETTWYVYDGDGKRVRKVTERAAAQGEPSRRSERLYLGSDEIYREYDNAQQTTVERSCYRVMDDHALVALIESESTPATTRVVRYQCVSHRRSSTLETDETGRVISYEEYHPFGTTAYQAVDRDIIAAAKRYRYTGMERDEESGLEYHSARYYAPWLGRWTAPDKHPEHLTGNRYVYAANNPIVNTDRNGLFEEPTHGALTYRLALAAGFSADDAARIAIADAGMDHHEATRPGDDLIEMMAQIWRGRTHEYHYPSQEEALARVNAAVADLSPGGTDTERAARLNELGRQLHSLQDVGFPDLPGPHARGPNDAGAAFLVTGLTAIGFGSISLIGAAQLGGSGEVGGAVALGILGGVLVLGGLYLVIFGIRAWGTGHPSRMTERGHESQWTLTTADQAHQDPEANKEQALRVFEILKRAAAAHGGAEDPDEAAAEEAIRETIEAVTQEDINKLLNKCVRDASGRPAPSYAEAVRRLDRARWRRGDFDASLESRETFKFEPARAACPR